jgi:hypothetical protein
MVVQFLQHSLGYGVQVQCIHYTPCTIHYRLYTIHRTLSHTLHGYGVQGLMKEGEAREDR